MASNNSLNSMVLNYDSANNPPTFTLQKSRGGAAITSGDTIGTIFWTAFDGSTYLSTSQIRSKSSGTIGANRVASSLEFITHPDSVTGGQIRLTIASTGAVTIAEPDAAGATLLTVNGNIGAVQSSNDANGENIYIKKSRAGAIITTGDALGSLSFQFHDGVGYIEGSAILCTSSGTIGVNRAGTNLVFKTHPDSTTAATTRLTIASTGAITIASPDSGTGLTISGGGLTATGNITTATVYGGAVGATNNYMIIDSTGLQGSASRVVSTAWTPVLKFGGGTTGITYGTQTGHYVRVDTIVHFDMQIVLTSKGSDTGTATITGLPVAAANITPVTGWWRDTSNAVEILLSGSTITLRDVIGGTDVTDTWFQNNSTLYISGTYII